MHRTKGGGLNTLARIVVTVTAATTLVIVLGTGAGTAGAAPFSSVTAVTAAIASPSSAAGALTSYVVSLTTSASGALSGNAGDTVSVNLPTGTGLTNLANSELKVGGSQVGNCAASGTTVVSCDLFGGKSVAAGATATATLNGVNNPATAQSYTLSVHTSRDTTPVTSPAYQVTAAQMITGLTVGMSSPSPAAGALTTYLITFTTSSTGSLSADTGSLVNVALPAGTKLTNLANSELKVGGSQVGNCAASGTTAVSCDLFSGKSVAAGATATATLNGVNNPTTPGSYTATVTTTSDTPAVTSPAYQVTPASKVTGVSVQLSNNQTAAPNVTYQINLTLATGLSGDTGSTVTITFPAGTNLNQLTNTSLTSAGSHVGSCSQSSGKIVTCVVFGGTTVPGGTPLVANLAGITNPATSQPYTLKVSTSSDVETASTMYCVAAIGIPCISKASPSAGPVGTSVKVIGINLSGATAVAFNGAPAAITTDTATKVTTSVPANATTGPVTVTTPNGTATSPKIFTVN